MAVLTQQVIVELIIDESKLQPALDKLESSGQIDAKIAAGFRQTTAEINKQVVAAKADNAAIAPLKKSLGELALMAKKVGGDFEKGFAEGVTDALKEAGVSMAQFKRALGATNPGSSFDKLNKTLADTTKRVLDTSTRLEQLRRTGGAGTEAFNKLEKQLIADQRELKKLSEEFAKVKQAAEVLNGSEAENATESLRQRLKILTQQITELKLTGQDNTEQFREMVAEAGRIKDAMADAGAEIKNVASDTRVFDNLIGSAQAVAGGFAAAQGFVGLFGDESEDLQKTLLKVNSAMAVLQGLQQIGNALQKEGAVVQLLSNRQRIITNAQLAIENGLQSSSIVVRLGAAAAQRVLNAAMAANPIGIVVTALAGLITLLATYGRSAAEARRQTSNLNVALDAGAKAFEDRSNAIKQQGDAIINALENEGATASRLAQQEITNQELIINARKQRLAELRQLEKENTEADLEQRQALNVAIRALEDELAVNSLESSNLEFKAKKILYEEDLESRVAATEAALANAKEGSEAQLNLQKQLINQRLTLDLNADGLLQSQRAALIAKAEQERADLQSAFDKRRIDLQLKNIETQLVNVREGSQEELNLKLQQLRLQVQAENTSSKLSEAEKKAIREKGFQDQLKLQREFNARVRAENIQGQIDLNAVELVNVRTTAEDRLLLTISNIEFAAQLEIDAAKDNANKIAAIIAKRDADIAATRKADIEQRAQQEIELVTATDGVKNRSLQRLVENEKKPARARIAALEQLQNFELDNIRVRENALEEERDKKLIGDDEYNTRYAQLQDEKAKVAEETEKKITGINKDENEKRRKTEQETIELVIQTTQQVIDIIQQLNDARTQKDEERITRERERVQELRDAGAITEKEAILRNKRIDNEERKLKQQAAIRDKQIAIFNAVVNTAQAVTRALATGGPILAAIAGALGAAQIAIIASRPIPKFRTGKKNQYEGPGKIGEAGAELFEHNGKMYLAKNETLVWLGKNDKVYTPGETKQMLPEVDKSVMEWKPDKKQVPVIDYDQLGKSVGKHVKIPGINIDEDGIKVWQQEGMSRKNYMDKRYSSK